MTDRLFLDTNIVLDLLGERHPHYLPAAKIATLADRGDTTVVVSALTYSTVFYVLRKFEKKDIVKKKLRKFRTIVSTSDLSDKIISKALHSNFSDFEDALQFYSAMAANCTILVTRNEKDFKESTIPVFNPNEYLIQRG